MLNQVNYKEYHINKDGKKVAGTAHQIYLMTHPDPFVVILNNRIDPFVIISNNKGDR